MNKKKDKLTDLNQLINIQMGNTKIPELIITKVEQLKWKKPRVIILDNNPLSIACYMEEFRDKVLKEKEKGEKQ